MHVHFLRYLPLVIVGLCLFILIWKKWDFFKGVLSDGTVVTDKDGKPLMDNTGNPIILGSATRVISFIFALMCIICEIYTTVKTEKFADNHLYAFLISIGVLLGFIKIVDMLGIWKGVQPKAND